MANTKRPRLHRTPIGPVTPGNLPPRALEELTALLPVADSVNHLRIWEMGGGVYVAEGPADFGPREPALVWTGSRWVSSEDELTAEESELMDRVAAKLPSGLGGWS